VNPSDDAPTEPAPSKKKEDPRGKRDDLVAIVAVLGGIAIAFEGRGVKLGLGAGVALALGGVLLAIRGGKRIDGRWWIVLALITAIGSAVGRMLLELYQEFQAGQWFADGAPTGATVDDFTTLYRTVAGMRIATLAGSMTVLLGGLANRFLRK
jgi:hypothetical protein